MKTNKAFISKVLRALDEDKLYVKCGGSLDCDNFAKLHSPYPIDEHLCPQCNKEIAQMMKDGEL